MNRNTSGMVRESRRALRWWKIALWTLAVPPVLCILLLMALTFAGWWVESRYLRDEIRLGPGDSTVVRAHGARFEWWALNFYADSVQVAAPGFDARAGRTEIRLDWIDGLLALRPAARLDIDTLWLRAEADTMPREKTPLDSLIFADFSLPVAATIAVRGLAFEDDSGLVTRVRGAMVRSRGSRAMSARLGRIETRWTKDLEFGADATLDWSAADSVDWDLTVRRLEPQDGRGLREARLGPAGDRGDFVRVGGRHAKAPLWRGRDSLIVEARDISVYQRVLQGTAASPRFGSVRLRSEAVFGDSLTATLRLEGEMAAWRVTPDFPLGAQEATLEAAWRGDRGTLAFHSRGDDGADVRLDARARLLPSWRDYGAAPWERAAMSLRGHARGLSVRVRDTLRTADVTIDTASWDGRRAALAVTTGDSSRLAASGDFAPDAAAGALPAGRARFTLALTPRERWVKAFVGENVTFTGLQARGEYKAGKGAAPTITATIAAEGLESYGAALDSARLMLSCGFARDGAPRACDLSPSPLNAGGDLWKLSGAIAFTARGPDLKARLDGGRHGRLDYALESSGAMEAEAENFRVTALPYAPLDSLPLRDGTLDGSFRWHPARREGRADLKAEARYVDPRGQARRAAETVSARVAGEWTPRLLNLREAAVAYRGSDLVARGRVRLNGKEFYELAKVAPGDYEAASLSTDRIDLGDLLAAFLPEPPLTAGVIRGSLAYSDTGGFAGGLAVSDLALRDPPQELAVRTLRLDGRGDSLLATVVTTSPAQPLLNDSIRATLTGARGEWQRLRVEAMAGGTLRLDADAVLRNFASLRGTLQASGAVPLPASVGLIDSVEAALDFDFPVLTAQEFMARGTLRTRIFKGIYAAPGQPRQRLSLDPSLQDGIVRVTNLAMENDQGHRLDGNLVFDPKRGTLEATASGERFALQWGDDYGGDVRDLRLEFRAGPAGTKAVARFASGGFRYADPPLRVAGRMSNVRADFTRPPPPASGRRAERAADSLRISGVLLESEVIHRLRSLADIQRLLRRQEQRPGASAPLVLDVKVRTQGARNTITSDIIRLSWVGDLSVRGAHPYTLFEGRVNALEGRFGIGREAYDIRRLNLKWLNAPAEEGEIHMEARKSLARSCASSGAGVVDSCTVITRLDGTLDEMLFSYDSDCGGAFGAGANVAAILYSVQRGCYDASITTGNGSGYGERALTLLEPTISRGLTQLMGPVWGRWIETADVTGLGSLSPDDVPADSLGEALSLALTSREYRRLRLKVRSGYHTASQELSNPWEHMLAIEWRPPLPAALRDSLWRARLNDNLRVAASVQTRPIRRSNPETDAVERKIGLFYNHVFWGEWWTRKEKRPEERGNGEGGGE